MEMLSAGCTHNTHARRGNTFTDRTINNLRVQTLICIHALLKVLDRTTIVNKLVPALKECKRPEPAVLVRLWPASLWKGPLERRLTHDARERVQMATLGVMDELGRKYLDKEAIAFDLLPSLWKYALQPTLNAHQVQPAGPTRVQTWCHGRTLSIRRLGPAPNAVQDVHDDRARTLQEGRGAGAQPD